ncbi:MAG: hypothetical protein K0R17_1254 [Rariglobus sp.]|jgi:hypothetical protein|nr:hypothetical protein [Rariglobus sp.]
MKPHVVAVFAASILLSGCVPIPIPHSRRAAPAFAGRVIDAETKKPVKGVDVTVLRYRTKDPVVTVQTDAEGRYRAEKKEMKWFYPLWLGPAEGIKGGVVEFRMTGYVGGAEQRTRFSGANSFPTFEVNYELQKEH